MNSYKVIFTVKTVLRVFVEVVQANDVEHAKTVVEALCKDAHLKLDHITAVIQVV
jgi:hypothetical protein